ncbi:MobQ family relaxase [Xanthomonas sp. BRIP62409]|uniref:MobQ family relaxase n=1 Tax=Xanthomonas sp. BRIP62409 TaxID=2182388 RepID=UPI000F8D2422|nr:MobQ family relaxase [Xanthomonas sp. BRIP62409]
MAIYHANVKTFSRAKGHSSIAAAAYRAGLLLEDERTGQRHDYRRRDGVVETRCVIPEGAPDWALIPAALWTQAEASERRKDSTIAREFEFALPHELSDEQRSALAAEVTRALVDRYGFAAQASIHSPGNKDGQNWHVHVLATTRRLGPEGFTDKTKELDGGPSGRAEVEWVRELVARVTNAHLEAASLDIRIDHRSLKAQADDALARGDLVGAAVLSREPTKHMGKNASAIERRGGRSQRGEVNRLIEEDNEESFNEMLAQFEQEGRAMDMPPGHSRQQARHESRRASPGTLTFSDGRIEMSQGMARVASAGRQGEDEKSGQATVTLESIREQVVQLGATLRDDLAVQGLHTTLNAVQVLAANPLPPDDSKDYRSILSRLLVGLRRFAAALARFPRRLEAVRRAVRLRHMAEQSWHDFVANHPEPGVPWAAGDWAKRRGRRLAALEQRSAELARAQAAATPEQEMACAQELVTRAEHLEGVSQAFLERPSPRPEGPAISPTPRLRPAPSVEPPAYRPARRRPRLH